MPTLISNANTTGFLSNDFPHGTPKLYLTAESDDFDDLTVQDWQNEGFNVNYLSMSDGGRKFAQTLDSLKDGMGVGETFAIIGMLASRDLRVPRPRSWGRCVFAGCAIAYSRV